MPGLGNAHTHTARWLHRRYLFCLKPGKMYQSPTRRRQVQRGVTDIITRTESPRGFGPGQAGASMGYERRRPQWLNPLAGGLAGGLAVRSSRALAILLLWLPSGMAWHGMVWPICPGSAALRSLPLSQAFTPSLTHARTQALTRAA
ncbi:hypothetical protein VFPBJ_05070 [Purpureocillium lilacinum]|uniref:Uncharacterized protein n=1 Tax=Purpureocillium lilacinum TaxID=33203 RepID=A0A179GWY8_PURLI|nr:hypothetical protein VFPBJ_05070 [Purpureocillium lilacinum]